MRQSFSNVAGRTPVCDWLVVLCLPVQLVGRSYIQLDPFVYWRIAFMWLLFYCFYFNYFFFSDRLWHTLYVA